MLLHEFRKEAAMARKRWHEILRHGSERNWKERGMFGVQTFASIDTDIGVAIHVRDDLLRAGCLHDNHLYFVAHRRRFAVIKMIAADYTIALARAARLVHLASRKSIVARSSLSLSLRGKQPPPSPRSTIARDLQTVPPPPRNDPSFRV